MVHKSARVKYEPASEPLHISVKQSNPQTINPQDGQTPGQVALHLAKEPANCKEYFTKLSGLEERDAAQKLKAIKRKYMAVVKVLGNGWFR